MLTIAQVLARTQIIGYSATDKIAIENNLKNIRVYWAIFFIIFFIPFNSLACVKSKNLSIEEQKQATIVFRGKINSYIYASTSQLKNSGSYNLEAAKINFNVMEVYRGKIDSKTIDVYLKDSTIYGIPKNIDEYIKHYKNESIIGIAKVNKLKSNTLLSQVSNDLIKLLQEYQHPFIKDDNFEQSYWIIQHPCSLPYIKNQSK